MIKVALVTAGGSGMGAAAARKLAETGHAVGILSSSGKGEALAEELGGLGVTGVRVVADGLGPDVVRLERRARHHAVAAAGAAGVHVFFYLFLLC